MLPLIEIPDQQVFTSGMRFRVYQIGLNVADPADDYYEYMLAEIPGERNYMLLTNVKGPKAGNALALVETDKHRFVVTGEALKYSLGTEATFWLPKE